MQELTINKILDDIPKIKYRRPNYQIPILNRISNEIRSQQFPSNKPKTNKINELRNIKPLKLPNCINSSQQSMLHRFSKRVNFKTNNLSQLYDFESSSRQIRKFLEQEKKQQQSELYISSILSQVKKPGSSVRINNQNSQIFSRKRSKSHDNFDRINFQDFDTLDSYKNQIL